MGLVTRKLKEIKRLQKEQDSICTDIIAASKKSPLLIVKDTWSNPNSKTGFNYKGRACQVQDMYIQKGQVWIKPKILTLKTNRFSIEVRNYYREDHFREINSYEDLSSIDFR